MLFFSSFPRSTYQRVYRFFEQTHGYISNYWRMRRIGWLWGFTRSSTIGTTTFAAAVDWYKSYTAIAWLFCSMYRIERSNSRWTALPFGHGKISTGTMVLDVQNVEWLEHIFEALLELFSHPSESSHIVTEASTVRYAHSTAAGTGKRLLEQ